jgi:hypothetical protein
MIALVWKVERGAANSSAKWMRGIAQVRLAQTFACDEIFRNPISSVCYEGA